jgi:hypothetical protein
MDDFVLENTYDLAQINISLSKDAEVQNFLLTLVQLRSFDKID